jgi:hypothetical protein
MLLAYGSRFALKSVTPLQTIEWKQAFTDQFDTDAHAWPYLLHAPDGSIAVPQIRVPVKEPERVFCYFVFLDYDGLDAFDHLHKIPQDHFLWRPCAIYKTKAGMRLVYRLEEPVTAAEYGPLVRGMALELWHRTSLRVDPSTDQWTRCFRLPKVTRSDGKADGPTWLQDYFVEPGIGDDTLDPDELPRRKDKLPWAATFSAPVDTGDKPDLDEELHPGRQKLYKSLLRISRFRSYIFEDAQILPGRRDPTLLAMAGEIVSKAFKGVPESSAVEIFLLLLPIVMQMEKDAGEEWHDKLWRMVTYSWSQEAGKEAERKKQHEEDCTARDFVVEKMLTLLPAEEVPNDTIPRSAFASRHFCLQTGRGAFVVQKDGTYSTQALQTSQLPAHFNEGLQFLVEGGFRKSDGEPMKGQRILDAYSTNVDTVEYVAATKQETRLIGIGEKRVLQVTPFCLRPDLVEQAELDADIDGWLETFDRPILLKRWLAASLALHLGGVASLYLHGPARVGKSMLAQGVAECFHAQPVPGAQAFSEYNGGLFDSPVVMIDEGLPNRTNGVDTADMFRSMVTGGPVSVMKKYGNALVSKIPYRLVFTANSFDMVRQLIGRRTMGPQDRDAFRERILVMDTGSKPAEYLDSRGAMEFTRHHKKGSWIGGECRLARHLIRLYQMAFEESAFCRAGRLLVEGEAHPSFTLSFDLSGAGRDVVDDLTGDIKKRNDNTAVGLDLMKALEITDGRVWVKKRPYCKFSCSRSGNRNTDGYTVALERFLSPTIRSSPNDMTTQTLVDMQKLIFCAQAEGLDYKSLEILQKKAAGVA